jgi:hypothetical protein
MKASHFGCVDTIVCHFPVKQHDFVAEKLLFVEISHLRFYEDMPELIRIFLWLVLSYTWPQWSLCNVDGVLFVPIFKVASAIFSCWPDCHLGDHLLMLGEGLKSFMKR